MAVLDPNGALRKLVPLAAFVMAEEDFIDAPLQAVVAAMRSQPSMECLVRFTRLSYATIRANCVSEISLMETSLRLLLRVSRDWSDANDELEDMYTKFARRLAGQGLLTPPLLWCVLRVARSSRSRKVLWSSI